MTTYAKPYLSELSVNLNEFNADVRAQNAQGQPVLINGKQKPMLGVKLQLWLDENTEVGYQEYTFTDKATPATPSHSGLPDYTAVVSSEVSGAFTSSIESYLDSVLPAFKKTAEEGEATGPKLHARINHITAQLPYERPQEQSVMALVSLYEDEKFTRQLSSANFAVFFAPDEYVIRLLGNSPDITSAQIAQFRTSQRVYEMSAFFGSAAVQQGVGALATTLFAMIKSQVFHWNAIDVAAVMTDFQSQFAKLAPAPE